MIFVDVAMSLDGFIAGPNASPTNPLGDGGTRLHDYVFALASFRERLGLDGGESGEEDERVKHIFERTGAYVMGRRMFDEGEVNWPANAPFRAPVFVATHEAREPWVREGGTTFYFITEGVEKALERARAAAANKDVRVSGGADMIRQCLSAGVVDELTIHLAPIILGGGAALFDGMQPDELALDIASVHAAPNTTHLTYRIRR